MAKKKTKLDKMSKKERTSLAYALATNLAKHGKPQSIKEEYPESFHNYLINQGFDPEQVSIGQDIEWNNGLKDPRSSMHRTLKNLRKDPNYYKNHPQSPKNERKLTKGEINKKETHMGKFKKAFDLEEIQEIIRAVQEQKLENPKKADLNKDGKLSSYEKTRGAAIEKNMQKEGLLSKLAGGLAVLATLVAVGKINSSDPVIQDLKAKYEQADTPAEKDSLKDEIEARLIFLDTGMERVNEDLDVGHQDNEPRMLKADLYRIAKYASELYLMVNKFDDMPQEVDFPSWWQSKITLSKDYLVKAKHYLDGQLQVDKIDSVLGILDEDDKNSKEHKVLSTKELDRLAALPPTDPSFKKDRRHKKLMKKKNAKV